MPWPDDRNRVRELRLLALCLLAEIPPERLVEVGGPLFDEGNYDALAELVDLLGDTRLD